MKRLNQKIQTFRTLYSHYDQSRYKKYQPIVFFFGGFLWDSLTLTRIDRLFDNLILLLYLVLVGGCIILVNLTDTGKFRKGIFDKYKEWYPLGIQFFLGGLFSSYVVFYFQSASFTKSAIFLVLLVLLLIGNEFLEKRLTNLYLQSVLYFLTAFSFFIFFIPVVVKRVNFLTFLFGGILSAGLVWGTLHIIYRNTKIGFIRYRKTVAIVGAVYVVMNLFYVFNWIPPVPLSLKAGGVYHHVRHTDDTYVVSFEKPVWYKFWRTDDDPFYYAAGDTVFCFASVFAPTRLTKQIIHQWEYFEPGKKEWKITDRHGYQVTGGRRGGYRGYTYKTNIVPGRWRVDVETPEGWLLGRISFRVVTAEQDSVPMISREY